MPGCDKRNYRSKNTEWKINHLVYIKSYKIKRWTNERYWKLLQPCKPTFLLWKSTCCCNIATFKTFWTPCKLFSPIENRHVCVTPSLQNWFYKLLNPCKTLSPFEHRHLSSHRPLLKFVDPCKPVFSYGRRRQENQKTEWKERLLYT